MKVLVTYGSTHGSTARIAARIAERMRSQGAHVELADVSDVRRRFDASPFDAFVVGGRVHGSRYPGSVRRFVRAHVLALRSRPSAFFSVSLLQLSKDPAKREETLGLPARFFGRVGWTPDRVEVIAGALAWSRWGVFGRWLMRKIWKEFLGADVPDRRTDQEFTDWGQVDRFADGFLRFVGLNRGADAA
jgi:menaquinone-dependent protoporphyrinogen oxidase